MTSAYHQPGLPRASTWKLAAAAAVVLLLGGTAIAYATSANGFSFGSASTAEGSAGAGAPVLSLGVVSGAPLVPVEVPIRLLNAPGLGSASALLTYDPTVVAVKDVRAGDVPQGALRWHHDEAAGSIVMLLTTSLPQGATGGHVFAFVTLEAREGAVGEVSPLGLGVRAAVRAGGEAVPLEASGGTFRNGVPGDVLGDGTVDQADYDRLAEYLVSGSGAIIALNADLDGDGKVTDADAVRLHQYLDGTRDAP